MDLYPLLNSLRIAVISTALIFFVGLWAAQVIFRCPPVVKGILDVVLTLPLVLPPTVVGYLLLCLLGPNGWVGGLVQRCLDVRLTMVWYAAVFSSAVVAFPLMYRTARGAFESYDQTLTDAARTLGRSDRWIFWHIQLPVCRQGIVAGTVLAFARALGEYGATSMIAGYTPGKTATISTTVYQFWRTGNDAMALRWVLVNLGISAVVLLAINLLERKER
ncbi:molybdate ABC transporter permease subunit [Pseudoflavonifractor sp. An85]|uniref:molybdate ABC transporter permease subunit n=1 Tax=Pseudoflavonifractor sp. An85 TaxID=1965661 RepID=UPI000B3A7A05|nr:molybdate ABC transporter permease subunit [Pseudoflavonifractor sp. An85]OUN25428.1 molybdenum ABC transporter permease subunit [Pseudoflavonifractor sp. An85]